MPFFIGKENPMTSQELNTALYQKMFAEQEEFRKHLLTLPPEEILQHTYEYTMEIARAELAADSPSYDRSATSFPAYCVSYMLCKRNGIDVSGYSFDRLPESIRSGDPQTIREELTKVRDTASNISGRMARAMNPERQSKPRGQER